MKNIIKDVARALLTHLGLLELIRRWRFGVNPTDEQFQNAPIVEASLFPEYTWDIELTVVQSASEYGTYANQQGERHQQTIRLEQELAANDFFRLRATDPVTQLPTIFIADFRGAPGAASANFRENLVSPDNAFMARHRSIILAWQHLQVKFSIVVEHCYATEQLTSFYEYLGRTFPHVVGSEYLGDSFKSGEIVDGIRHESLTGLSFADASMDLLVSLDVLEHIPDYEKALHEIYRVLQPGGCALITAPFDPGRQDHLIRARINSTTGEIQHLMPPEYHGDPVNPTSGVLCFQTFGWAICDQLRAAGFSKAGVMPIWSLRYGVLGSHHVIYAIK